MSKNEIGICGKHSRSYWVDIVTPDPDHATSDKPNHVSVASYCALCVNERLIDEIRNKDEVIKNLRRISKVLDEFDGDYSIVDSQDWDALWTSLSNLDTVINR